MLSQSSRSFDFEGTKTNFFKVRGPRSTDRQLDRALAGRLVFGFGDFGKHLIVDFDSPVIGLSFDAKLVVSKGFGLVELLQRTPVSYTHLTLPTTPYV